MARLVVRLYRDSARPDYPINRNAPLRHRNQAIQAGSYAQGATLEVLAARFKLSVQRVHQIIAKQRQ
jgi:hypothetical protein